MAGKVLEYELNYIESGELKKDIIEIRFVSNYFIREYNHLMKIVLDVTENWDKYSDIKTEIAADNGDIEELKQRQEEAEQNILKYSDRDIDGMRFDLIEVILKDNAVKNEQYLTFDFWDRQVEPTIILEFLSLCAFKDIGKKKMM